MAVRAIRGAIQVDGYEREDILEGTAELMSAVMSRNELRLTTLSACCSPRRTT